LFQRFGFVVVVVVVVRCVALRPVLFEQPDRVTNRVADFLVGLDVVELVPALGLAIDLDKSHTGGLDLAVDFVDDPDFFGPARSLDVLAQVGTDEAPKVLVALMARKNVSSSTQNVGGLGGKVCRQQFSDRFLLLLFAGAPFFRFRPRNFVRGVLDVVVVDANC